MSSLINIKYRSNFDWYKKIIDYVYVLYFQSIFHLSDLIKKCRSKCFHVIIYSYIIENKIGIGNEIYACREIPITDFIDPEF